MVEFGHKICIDYMKPMEAGINQHEFIVNTNSQDEIDIPSAKDVS